MCVEAAGAANATLPQIEHLLAPAGRMVYLGRTGERVPVMLDTLVSGARAIVGSRGHAGGGCFPQILRLLERGRLELMPMITHRMPLLQAADGVKRSLDRRDAKILLVDEVD
jgi:threonine dehydrogenase-like Zn-dependent dehydrogenase